MRYIKLFELFENHGSYEELSFSDWTDLAICRISISRSTVNKLKEYLLPYNDQFWKKTNRTYIPGSGNNKSYFFKYKEIEIIVHECPDEWYAVALQKGDGDSESTEKLYYKCDQVEGITDMLKDNDI